MGSAAGTDPDLRAILAYWSVLHAASAHLLSSGARLPGGATDHHRGLLAAAARHAQQRGDDDLAELFAEANRHRPLVHRARYRSPRVFGAGRADRVAEVAHDVVEGLARRHGGRRPPPLEGMCRTDGVPATAWIVYARTGRPVPAPAVMTSDLRKQLRGGHVVRTVVHRDHVAGCLELAHTHLARAAGRADNDASLVAQFSWMGTIAAARALLLAHRLDIATGVLPRDAALLEVAAMCVQPTDATLAQASRSFYSRFHRLVALGRYDHPAAIPPAAAWQLFGEVWPVVADLSQRAQELAGGFTVHSRALTLPAVARSLLAGGPPHGDNAAMKDLVQHAVAVAAPGPTVGGTSVAHARC
jgi:hypothetical protein